ncbi:MAG: 2-hydroxyacyl-CoA dehydratase [Lachnospiraceae bacterium]|nr:2-hydroxyacyl-CoA dehydratase [Lachnospiraceae bacterium]
MSETLQTSTENKTQLDHVIYSRDVVHKHSKATQNLLNLCIDYIDYCKREFQAGKDVIWTMGMGTDTAILYSLGIIPASFTEIGRLCSGEAVVLAEEFFQVPNETCAMVKSDLGEFYLQRGKISNKIFYSSKACEPYNVAFQLLEDVGYDVHVMDVGFGPRKARRERVENIKKHYRDEYLKVIDWAAPGKYDAEKLRSELIFYNKIQRKIRTVFNLRAYHPTYIGSLPMMLLLMGNTHYFGKPLEYEATIDKLIEELSDLKPNEYHDEKAILCWSGARGQEFNIFEAIDEAGGAVLSWNIPNNTVHEFNTEIDPIDALVDFELGDLISGTTENACRYILKDMEKYGATGVILYGYLGCSFATIDIELKRKYFKEHDIPGLSLIGSFDVGTVTGQVTTRVRAFIEMLAKKREESKIA